MKITQCSDKSAWDRALREGGHHEFLQSWEWGDFREKTGATPQRLQFAVHEQVVGQAQGMIHDLGFGLRYLYMPRAAITREQLEPLRAYALAQGFAFVRIEPCADVERSKNIQQTRTRQPQDEWMVDLHQQPEQLLAAMHSKTRYNIRLAEKKGVTIETKKNSDVFWSLNTQTRDRDKFKSHDKTYYAALLQLDMVQQFTAMYQGAPIASIICARFGDIMTYVHGASSNAHRNVMAPYLLQWHAIQSARTGGAHQYSLGGVAPAATQGTTTSFHGYTWDPTHRFTGITRFKVGFGGTVRHYPDAVDAIVRPLQYRLYRLARKLKGYA